MTPYYESLPPVVKARLKPLLPVMQQAALVNGIPLDSLVSLAVTESGGRADIVGDRTLTRPAYGLYQVRDSKQWLGGADPMNPVAATNGLAPRVKKLMDDCNGDMACLHFKFNAGPNQAYTPENVARVSAKFPHVATRLATIQGAFGGSPAPASVSPVGGAGAPPSAGQWLGLPAPTLGDAAPAYYGPAQLDEGPNFFAQLSASLTDTGGDTGGRVKSMQPTTSLFGL